MHTPVPSSAPVADISDGALVRRLAEGDGDAMTPLYLRHARAVSSLLLRLDPERSVEQAADITQDVFITLLDKAAGYRDDGKLRSFLFGVAVRKARTARRTAARRNLLSRFTGAAGAGVAGPPSGPEGRVDAADRVGRALATLTPRAREVLILTSVEGLTGAEAAAVLGISEGAVGVRAHRARKALQGALDAQERSSR